jgi:DNA-binding NarL/FixJ family response regulator
VTAPPPAARPAGHPAAPRPLRIVVADDNPVVRAGLAALLREHPGLDVVAQAADGAEAYEAARRLRPDAVLLDVRMPGVDGLTALPHLAALAPVLMLTYDGRPAVARTALELGARGFLVHGEFTAGQLVAAVTAVATGRSAFGQSVYAVRTPDTRPPQPVAPWPGPEAQVAGKPYEFAQQSSHKQPDVGHSNAAAGAPGRPGAASPDLSRREGEVMALIASGLTNQQIAASCFISEKTVKNHINHIFAKLNAGSRGEAIAIWHGRTRREAELA